MSDEALSAEDVKLLKSLCAFIRAGGAATPSASNGKSSGSGWRQEPASDEDLDGRWGDPTVRKDPKKWAGASFAGARYSECPTDYLLVLAEYLEFSAGMDAKKHEPPKHQNGTPWYVYSRTDAARARGWARRNNGFAKAPPKASTNDAAVDDPYAPRDGEAALADDEIPF